MSKFFILVASLMCISTLAACSGRASTDSDPTSICPFAPFDAACTEERFNVNKIEHCNQTGLATRTQTGGPHANFERCTALAEEIPCLANPFQEVCETEPIFGDDNRLRTLRFFRVQLCSGGGGSGESCAVVNSCGDNGNPFGAECLEFADFDQNRDARITLCTNSLTAFGCRSMVGSQTIAQCIGTNPFHADCTHDDFNDARVARVAACSADTPATTLNCSSVIGVDIGTDDGTPDDGTQTIANCITAPFHADCQNLAFNTSRVNRLIACGAADDPSGINCDAARERATTAAWLRSFGTDRLDTEPDEVNPRNQFLQGTEVVDVPSDEDEVQGDEGGLDVGAVRTISGDRPRVFPLNLATARYGEIPEGGSRPPLLLADEEGEPTGDVSDGVAFFLGSAARNANAYAGILAGTDLGAVPPTTTESATWNGEFLVIGTYPVNKDFKLEIDFSAESLTAFVQVRDDEDDPLHFLLNGTFNRNGVIIGTVELGDYTGNVRTATPLDNEDRGSGMLTGLIGQEGAVGVFLQNNGTAGGNSFNFAGGFVAAPTPDPEPTP